VASSRGSHPGCRFSHLPAKGADGWDGGGLRKARRVICGHVSSTGSGTQDAKGELRELVSVMASAGARLMETAVSACVAEWGSNMESLDKALRVMVRYVRGAAAARAGPPRRTSAR
jgi:hypothetical protein